MSVTWLKGRSFVALATGCIYNVVGLCVILYLGYYHIHLLMVLSHHRPRILLDFVFVLFYVLERVHLYTWVESFLGAKRPTDHKSSPTQCHTFFTLHISSF